MKSSGPTASYDSISILNTLSSHIAIIDSDGMILTVNDAWKTFGEKNDVILERASVDTNYLETCEKAVLDGDDYALKALLGIRAVIDGRRDSFTLQYPCHGPEKRLWFVMHVNALDDDKGTFLISHENVTPTVRAERDLRETEQRYKMQFDHSLYGIMITAPDGRILDANPAACTILGRTRQEIIESGRSGIVDTEDPRLYEALEMRNKTGQFDGELRFVRKNGRKIDVEVGSRLFRNEKHQLRTIINFRDISNRKQIERKLLDEQAFTDSTVNSIPGTFFVLDTEECFIRWNKRFERITGYSADEITNLNARSLVVESDQDRMNEHFKKTYEEGESAMETTITTKNGELKEYYFAGKYHPREDGGYIVVTGLDITERRKLEQQVHDLLQQEKDARRNLEKTNRNLKEMIMHAPSAIAIFNGPDHRFRLTNEMYSRLVGGRDVIGKSVAETLPELEAQGFIKLLDRVYQSGEPFIGDEVPIRLAGDNGDLKEYYFNFVYKPLFDQEGKPESIFLEAIDVTEQVESREAISNTLKEKEKLLKELNRANEKLKTALKIGEMGYWTHDLIENKGDWSAELYNIWEVDPDEFEPTFENFLETMHPEDIHRFKTNPDKVFPGENFHDHEHRIVTPGGKSKWIFERITLHRDQNGKPHWMEGIAQDITEKKKKEEEIRETLQVKEVLLQEVHHRVKNNLALIVSLIELQLFETDNNDILRQELGAIKGRIHTIAKVHELMYQNEDLSHIPFHKYIHKIVHSMDDLFESRGRDLNVKIASEDLFMNANQAIPCGLLINELLSKPELMQPENSEGILSLEMLKAGENIRINLKSETIYLNELIGTDSGKLNDLLIQTLLNQLDANIKSTGRHTLSIKFKGSDHMGPVNALHAGAGVAG